MDISFPHTLHPMCIRKSCGLYLKIYHILASTPPSPSGQSQHESSSGFPVPSLFPFPYSVYFSAPLAEGSDPISCPPALLTQFQCEPLFCFWVYSSFPTSRGLFHMLASPWDTHLRFSWLIALLILGSAHHRNYFLTSLLSSRSHPFLSPYSA